MLSEVYQEVLIQYRENENDWRFELGGREKFAPSLRQARHAVDKAPKPKREAVRFKAYLLKFDSSGVEEVTVGAAGKNYRGGLQFWVSSSHGRSKEDVARLVKINDNNNVIIEEVNKLTAAITELQKERSEKIALLDRVDIPAEDAGDNHAKD